MLIQTYEGKSITEWALECKSLQRQLAIVRQEERERCAKVAEEYMDDYSDGNPANIIAALIRGGKGE